MPGMGTAKWCSFPGNPGWAKRCWQRKRWLPASFCGSPDDPTKKLIRRTRRLRKRFAIISGNTGMILFGSAAPGISVAVAAGTWFAAGIAGSRATGGSHLPNIRLFCGAAAAGYFSGRSAMGGRRNTGFVAGYFRTAATFANRISGNISQR